MKAFHARRQWLPLPPLMVAFLMVAFLMVAGAVGPARADPSHAPVMLSIHPTTPVQRLFSDQGRVMVEFQGRQVHQVRVIAGAIRLLAGVAVDRGRWKPAPQGLPDGEIARGEGHIRQAWLAPPTERYDHGVLGDAVEAAGMAVMTAQREILAYLLPRDEVFEDRVPRLVDVTGDGEAEILTVLSQQDRGAAVAVLGIHGGRLTLLGRSQPVGLAHRWLNPVGAADFDGDGQIEIAVVVTPHIGGILRVGRLQDGVVSLRTVGEGFSNHAIGSRELGMSAILDWNLDGVADMAIPDARRQILRIVTLAGGPLTELARQSHDARIITAIEAADLDGDGRDELVYGLDDGSLRVLVSP